MKISEESYREHTNNKRIDTSNGTYPSKIRTRRGYG